MRSAGDLNERISIERDTPTRDDYNEEVSDWAEIGKRWAKVWYGSGSERRESAAEREMQRATFQCRHDATTSNVTVKDRIVFDGSIWDIRNVSKMRDRGLVEFTAMREQ